MQDSVFGFCSFCFERTEHALLAANTLTRNDYACRQCGNRTLKCRMLQCKNMCRGSATAARTEGAEKAPILTWNDELCAEHDGTIASFERLTLRLTDIDRYDDLFLRNSIDVARVGKWIGFATSGAGLAAGVIFTGGLAAPVAAALGAKGLLGAASTGVAIASLKGAALTSASLAAIGGSVATGTAILVAAGAALGGAKGAAIASEYHADDPSFSIRRLNTSRSNARTVFVNGFLEGSIERFDDWATPQLDEDPDQNLYGVTWSAKSRQELTQYLGVSAASKSTIQFLKNVAETGGKAAAKNMRAFTLIDIFGDLLQNPWHVSMFRAMKAGAQLAEAIARTDGKQYTLVGHSLGCRVIFYALLALATKAQQERPRIANVVLLGGAVGRSALEEWRRATDAVEGLIVNCHSSHDHVLSALYQTANAGLSSPAGLAPVHPTPNKVENVDCSGFIKSHFDWKPRYIEVVHRIRRDVRFR